jgi:glycolate oxidase FAD binding subunit
MARQTEDKNMELALQAQVEQAVANGSALRIEAGGSKSFYGYPVEADALRVAGHSGIIDYDPAELVISLRAGCKLDEVEALLAENNQMLGFEPPHFGDNATIGGIVATGFTGPRRAFAGAVRDFILGVKILNGRGEITSFGGRVIKNVAGFDVSRLMVGAQGTLGVILDISLRVLPRFETEQTLVFEHADAQDHIRWINEISAKPIPVSASMWHRGQSFVRLSGSAQGVASAVTRLGGEQVPDLWAQLREQSHEFFNSQAKLLRVSVPQTCEDLFTEKSQLIEWGGAQRWITSEFDLEQLRRKVEGHQGTVCVYRGADPEEMIFHPLNASMLALHRSLKSSFDPARIFNPGRLYREL